MGAAQSFPVVPLPKEQIVLITGGNQGIGYYTAKWIAMMGATVIIACRSQQRAEKAIQDMQTEFSDEKRKGTKGLTDSDKLSVEYMQLDLASLRSVMDFIEAFKGTGRKLNTLICNAGILATNGYEKTEDGFERMFQVNYLSHFIIVAHLSAIMKTSGEDCRIINLSSSAHEMATFDAEDVAGRNESNFNNFAVYSKTKIYQIMMMFSLNRYLMNTSVTVTSLHPGIVETEMMQDFRKGCLTGCIVTCAKCFGQTKPPHQGAWTPLNTAVNQELKGVRDVYFADSKPKACNSKARNRNSQDILWNFTKECVKNHLPSDVINSLETS